MHCEALFECRVSGYASDSLTGISPSNPNKQNQDSFITIKDFNAISNAFLFAVLDGHGVNGHLASSYVKRRFPINLEQAALKQLNTKRKYKNNVSAHGGVRKKPRSTMIDQTTLSAAPMLKHEAILEAFKMTNNDLCLSNVDITLSGTTLVAVLLAGDFLICANVGDSRAVIGSLEEGKWKARAISHDHKPDSPRELKRITKSNGRVRHYMDSYGNPVGPSRVWKQSEDTPGLAMSRALGDKSASEAGVIAVPDIVEERLKNEDRILLVASDGVWEYLNNLEAIKIVGECWKEGAEEAARKLVREARSKWEGNREEAVDDITAVVVFLN
eukprot:TRINITY_DN3403_c0_g4_i1.p1 TRINITY_DN3403_c0_g4~~TRINITY_DN3403_c0_g4_i1.p1  ORF type:complete len:329 (+),score=81.58 TRINITY_DN3403_c0_g4_i1:805-1791(+)